MAQRQPVHVGSSAPQKMAARGYAIQRRGHTRVSQGPNALVPRRLSRRAAIASSASPASALDSQPVAMPSSRIPLPNLDDLDQDQQRVADEVAKAPRGEVRGPVRVWLHSPELASRAQRLGEHLRWGT